jgi:hypothetical protein
MIIKWTGIQTVDPESNVVTILEAKLEGKSIHVDVTQEAIEGHGVEACKRVAEQKIVEAVKRNRVVVGRVTVTSYDFLESDGN